MGVVSMQWRDFDKCQEYLVEGQDLVKGLGMGVSEKVSRMCRFLEAQMS